MADSLIEAARAAAERAAAEELETDRAGETSQNEEPGHAGDEAGDLPPAGPADSGADPAEGPLAEGPAKEA
jgi:hypothetical protein